MQHRKQKKVVIKVDNLTFHISAYCYQKIEMTENMKFKVKCKEYPDYNREFDDLKEMTDYIGQFIYNNTIDLML